MKEFFKKNWLAIVVTCAIFGASGGVIWWTNQVYIPRENARRLAEWAEAHPQVQEVTHSDYDYTISTSTNTVPETNEDSAVTVRTDENGEEWIDRDWVADEPGEDAAAGDGTNMETGNTPTITGDDGIYHGESADANNTTPKGGTRRINANGEEEIYSEIDGGWYLVLEGEGTVIEGVTSGEHIGNFG